MMEFDKVGYSIGFVGAGPTTIFCLQELLSRRPLPAAITIFEQQSRAGQGTPYSDHWSDPVMLANIASIEIPALPQSLIDWLDEQSDAKLMALGVDRSDIDERAFFPRVALGEYLARQFEILVGQGRASGVTMEVRTRSTVTDVRVIDQHIELAVATPRAGVDRHEFDYVILATGHQWPSDPEVRPGYFSSPWPASALKRIRCCRVGIRGSSLSAIDATVALADHHGSFKGGGDTAMSYEPDPNTENFAVTLFSRKGILPEADFYHPVPYEPLSICTPEAVTALIERTDTNGLLDDVFELFRRELFLADLTYAQSLELEDASLEEFSERYFAERMRNDPFTWARENLLEARQNNARSVTVPWRYVILRMHEVIALIVPNLSDEDFNRFNDYFKPVFVDNYATVPHESIERLLSLRAAGKLSVEKLTDGARLDTYAASGGAALRRKGSEVHFPAFIEATGQRPLSAKDFPFPSLKRQGLIQDVRSSEGEEVGRGIAVDDQYHPATDFYQSDRLFCLSLPYLLAQHPFAQGITSSAEMARVVADAIEEMETPIRVLQFSA